MAISLFLLGANTLEPKTPEPRGAVDIRLEGLRSHKGVVLACLSRNPTLFLKCDRDPASYKAKIPADGQTQLHFTGVAPGDYALAIVHDENGNMRVDKMLGIPKEGVGFSRNPVLIMGPPRFDAVRFHVADTPVPQVVKLRYFL